MDSDDWQIVLSGADITNTKEHWNWILCDGYMLFYWPGGFLVEVNSISWNYWVIWGQNLWWGLIMRSWLGVTTWNFRFCAVFLHIRTADMGYIWCRFENVIKVIYQVWCRCLITWTGNMVSRMAAILRDICQHSFNITKTYSCLQKVVVLVKLWQPFSFAVFFKHLRKCRTVTLLNGSLYKARQLCACTSVHYVSVPLFISVLLFHQGITWRKRQH